MIPRVEKAEICSFAWNKTVRCQGEVILRKIEKILVKANTI